MATNDLVGPWHLLVDDYALAGATNLARLYYLFQKYAGNPVLVPERPWEQLPYVYGTVLREESGGGLPDVVSKYHDEQSVRGREWGVVCDECGRDHLEQAGAGADFVVRSGDK